MYLCSVSGPWSRERVHRDKGAWKPSVLMRPRQDQNSFVSYRLARILSSAPVSGLDSGLGSALALEKSRAHCPTAEMHGQRGSVPGTGEQTDQWDGGIKLRLSKIDIVTIWKPCKESRKFRLYLLHVWPKIMYLGNVWLAATPQLHSMKSIIKTVQTLPFTSSYLHLLVPLLNTY